MDFESVTAGAESLAAADGFEDRVLAMKGKLATATGSRFAIE